MPKTRNDHLRRAVGASHKSGWIIYDCRIISQITHGQAKEHDPLSLIGSVARIPVGLP
jgi:hypothetical protein